MTGIDPAEYPFRVMFSGPDYRAPTIIVWLDTVNVDHPISDELRQQIDIAFLAGGHVLLLTASQEHLDRAAAAICLIAAPYLTELTGYVQ